MMTIEQTIQKRGIFINYMGEEQILGAPEGGGQNFVVVEITKIWKINHIFAKFPLFPPHSFL